MQARYMPITKITGDHSITTEDLVAIEAQYDVEINGCPAFSFTCTPADLAEMTTGALYSRGFIRNAAQITSINIADSLITVTLDAAANAPANLPEQQPGASTPLDAAAIFHTVQTLFNDPDTLFCRTGCAHSCSLLHGDAIICTFEDIGRHNALDKVIGYALRSGIPMSECAVFTSGRISGDYMAKIIRAGLPITVSRAAVTTEAIRLAREHDVTLYGFTRGNSTNLYNR